MAKEGFLFGELDAFYDSLMISSKESVKQQKKLLRTQGTKLKRKTVAQIRLVNLRTITGNYKAGIKRGKVWKTEGSMMIRVYSNAPHAHLIEDGHIVYTNNGVDFVQGRQVFARAEKGFEPEFEKACEEAIDEMIRKL